MAAHAHDPVDVAIIGCGPVGALAACLLGQAGLRIVVLEAEPTHYPLPRAVHLDHEMMRLFQSAGVIDAVLPDMIDTDGHLHIGADHQVIRYMGTVGQPRPFGWSNDWFFYQPELETHLRHRIAQLPGVTLRLGARFTSLDQQGESVTVHWTEHDQLHQVRARWVIGTDGARSAVRKALGVALDDLGFEEPWLVVDAEVDGQVRFPLLTGVPPEADLQRLSVMMCDPKRPATVVPGRGNHRRWEFMLLPGEDDAEMMTPARVGELVGAWMADVPHRIVRAATYRFHGLIAEQWQVGNVFLAGDAAHQTPPFFGQGMCHGLRDVANLAWKLSAIAQDGAAPAILSTYQPEREPHVRAVIGAAVAAGRYICERDPTRAAERDRAMVARLIEGQHQTAHDLIPPLNAGVVLTGTPGAGLRFIQPVLADGRWLDALTGQGWRLFAAPGWQADAAQMRGVTARGVTVIDPATLPDDGAVSGWLAAHAAHAVLLRPDHYVFGTGPAVDLLAARAQQLGLTETVA